MRIIPTFDTCCCLFSLKSSTIAIGSVQAVLMLILIMYNIYYSEKVLKSQVYTRCAVLAVIGILDILLVFGAKNKYWLPVKLWIVFNTIILMGGAYFINFFVNSPVSEVTMVIIIACKLYCLLVVNSFYRHLIAESALDRREECMCNLPQDISILYIQNTVPEVEKCNQWPKQIQCNRLPVLDPI